MCLCFLPVGVSRCYYTPGWKDEVESVGVGVGWGMEDEGGCSEDFGLYLF